MASLCHKALFPHDDRSIPAVAAVCVYPAMVRHAKRHVGDTSVKVASVATAFPSGQTPLKTRLAEVRGAVADGADEIDMVINRGAFLAGEFGEVQDEIAAVVEACGDAALKVILEVSELETPSPAAATSSVAAGWNLGTDELNTVRFAAPSQFTACFHIILCARDGRTPGLVPPFAGHNVRASPGVRPSRPQQHPSVAAAGVSRRTNLNTRSFRRSEMGALRARSPVCRARRQVLLRTLTGRPVLQVQPTCSEPITEHATFFVRFDIGRLL